MSRLMQRLTRLEQRYPPALAPAAATLADVLEAILGDQPDQPHRAAFLDLVRDVRDVADRQIDASASGVPLTAAEMARVAQFEALVAEKGATLGYDAQEGKGDGHAWA